MSLIAHPSLASPHHQSSRADIAARSIMSDRFRSSLLASVSSTNHRQRLPSKSSSSYSSAHKSPNDHQAQNQSGEGERQRRRRRDVILLPTCTALVLATSSSENAAHAMLVDESKSISAASTILESLVSVFNGETGLLVSSGFVWSIAANDNNWYVATTATDLSKNSKSLQVEFADGREYAATVAFSDIDTNIAFLRVNKVEGNNAGAPPPKAAKIGRSGNLKVGQDALAAFKESSRRGGGDIGNSVIRSGIVSGLNRTVPSVTGRPLRNCIQTTASFPNEGGGGVLVDSGGAVIGILAPTYTGKSGVSAGTNNGIFFAVGVDSYVLISEKLF